MTFQVKQIHKFFIYLNAFFWYTHNIYNPNNLKVNFQMSLFEMKKKKNILYTIFFLCLFVFDFKMK